MSEKSEKENKKVGLIVSVTLHVALLILFAIFGLTSLDPPPEDGALAINFGTVDAGMMTNNDNPPAEETQSEPVEENVVEPEPVETVDEEIITQDNEEAASINEKKEKQEEVVEPVEKKEEPKPNRTLSMADRMNSKNAKQSGGDGNTNQAGDQGDLNGDPNSTNYDGVGGNGNGTTFNLAGRGLKSTPTIKDNSQDEGTVVVDIIVDKYGKVVRATPGARGSNTTSSILFNKAKEAALNSKFSANPDAPESQKGTMTFIFILN